MVHEWYYGRGDSKAGPFTSNQLIDLATHGVVQPTDTVWRSGVTAGVPANRVKNLFAKKAVPTTESVAPVADPMANWPGLLPLSPVGIVDDVPANPVQASTTTVAELVTAGVLPGLVPLSPLGVVDPIEPVPTTTTLVAPPPPAPVVRKARAIAGKGCVIVGQDGKTVKFRGKCITCGYEAAGYQSMNIPRGAHRTTFFCNKCRKVKDVELQGML